MVGSWVQENGLQRREGRDENLSFTKLVSLSEAYLSKVRKRQIDLSLDKR